ncbi:hypothetical protein NHP21005_09020 [Helicobacter sp. NHP21005]|uniref:hypothetical protein n=1 Tax=Helicobacter felistomachi TaxID=3040201 RepID=UPI003EB712C8|nr:hypothetical protein NHP21005_09020 [Helicobacter sp. NHP21005]
MIECVEPEPGGDNPYLSYKYKSHGGEKAIINTRWIEGEVQERGLEKEYIDKEQSILPQKTDAELYPKPHALVRLYSGIRLYSSWSFGRLADIRKLQSLFQVAQFVEEDFSNFVTVVEKAKAFDVPLFCNEALVNSLLDVRLDTPIPPELYASVVEVFIWLQSAENGAQMS